MPRSRPDGVMSCLTDGTYRDRNLGNVWPAPANVDIATTRRLVEGMAERFGDEIHIDGPSRYSFTTRGLGWRRDPLTVRVGCLLFRPSRTGWHRTVDKRKITALGELRFILSELHRLPYDMAFALLSNVEGVGSKIGDCVLLFSLDKHQAFPVDTHVEQALRRWYLSDAEIEALPRTQSRKERNLLRWGRERFGPNAGYTSQYIFYDQRKVGAPRLP